MFGFDGEPMWFCGIILACKVGLESACDRIFWAVLGGFSGGYCARAIIGYYHLSGFFVWDVYALCIFFGVWIGGAIYEKLAEHKYRCLGIIVKIYVGLGALVGGFSGGYCARAIIGYYHLSGFFVWVVYALCIFFGVWIGGAFFFYLANKVLESKVVIGLIVGFILGTLTIGFFGISSGFGIFLIYALVVGGFVNYGSDLDKKRLAGGENDATDPKDNPLFLEISLIAKMAKIDGRISPQEAEHVSSFLDMICEGDQDLRQLCKEVFNSAKDDPKTIYEYAKEYKQISIYEQCENVYNNLWVIAMADGELHDIERETLKNILRYLGLDSGLYEKYFQKYCPYQNHEESYYESNDFDLEKYYKILKCFSTDSLDAIKKAYRKLASEYHPDRIQSKNLPEAFIIFANEKLKEINHAYEMIVKFRKE